MARATTGSGQNVRQLAESDVDTLHRFVSAQMRVNRMGAPPSRAHLRWKYFRRQPQFCHAAFDADGQMVGALGRVSRPFYVYGREYTTTEATDAFVTRQYQGKGLFQRLVVTARRAVARGGVAFSLARPNRNSRPGALRAGHRQLCELQMYVRPLTAGYVLSRLTGREVPALPSSAKLLAQLSAVCVARLGQVFHRLEVAELDRFDERMDDLWRAARRGYGVGVVRDREYMTWRYADCPTPYQRYALLSKDRLLGVAVTRLVLSEEGVLGVEIADLLTGAEDRGHLAFLLLGHIMIEMMKRDVQLMRCFVSGGLSMRDDPLRAALRLHGFLRRPAADTALLIRPESDKEAVELLLARGNWRFRAGDLDSI